MTGETRLVGLLGDPVGHSLSPRMQNAGFAALALDWAYVALPVEAERLEQAVAGLVALGFAGANVTIPHKTAIVAFCDELDEVAARAGSVNTLVVRDRRVLGSSTDGPAVVGLVEPVGARVLVLGAGGAAQAVATALGDAGAASIAVGARDGERAHALAVRLRTLFPELEILAVGEWPPDGEGATLVVNATPIRDEAPVSPAGGQQVVDLAYRADGSHTAFVAAARQAGCERVVDGLDVLLAQGALSFERWTGIEAPVDVMRAALGRGEPAA
ncbi:MAG TPA: shikimate dehydrogenase [Gaiellaceae bacterium]|nr:shikimate dehydrogenase [Gaiellaceae bacterium]